MTFAEPRIASILPTSNLLSSAADPDEPRGDDRDSSAGLEPFMPPPKPKNNIYRRYFTPEECAMLDAFPDDDVTAEIDLLRTLLAETFARVPPETGRKKPPLDLKFQYDLIVIFCRTALVIAALVKLQLKFHPKRNDMFMTVLEMIRQVNEEEGVI